jgi:hypothetical protein
MTAASKSRRSTGRSYSRRKPRRQNTRPASTWRSPAAGWCCTRAARSSGSRRRALNCLREKLVSHCGTEPFFGFPALPHDLTAVSFMSVAVSSVMGSQYG